MIFIFFFSLFISCHAMEEEKPFPFLKLPPDLQTLMLSFVDVHNKNINWESEATFRKKLETIQQAEDHSTVAEKLKNKFNISGHICSHSYFQGQSICLPFVSRFAISPDNSKIAAVGFEHDTLNLCSVDLNNKTLTVNQWIDDKKIDKVDVFHNLEAIAISSNGSMIGSLIRKASTYLLRVDNKLKEEKQEFVINFLNSSIPPEDIEGSNYLVDTAYLAFNVQGTHIGARIKDITLKKEIISIFCVDSDPRVKFLKRLCKKPEKQIMEAARQ